MTKFSKKDFYFSVITGFYAGLIGWLVLLFLGVPPLGSVVAPCYIPPCPMVGGFSWAWLMVIVPVLWVLGVNLGYFLGRWFSFFNQFGKYAAVGFTNFAVDAGVANFLFAVSGIASGWQFSAFKAVSFFVAVLHSYFWNRRWVFESAETDRKEEFAKFLGVNLVAIAVNVGTASLVVNGIEPAFGLNANVWANVGVVAGSAVALIFTFLGFRFIVFKKNK